MAAIGYALMYPQRFYQLAAVKPHHFSDERRAQVWEAITTLLDVHGTGLNPVLVSQDLARRALFKGTEAMDFIVECQDHARNAPDPESAGSSYCAMIVDSGLRRRMRESGRKLEELSTAPLATEEMRMDMQGEIFELLNYETVGNQMSLEATLDEEIKKLDAPYEPGPPGMMTGHTAFDDLFNGFVPGDFVVIGARPSIGKTSLATQWAAEWGVRRGIPGGIWSLEMKLDQLIPRVACQLAKLDGHRMGRKAYLPGELAALRNAHVQLQLAAKAKTLHMVDTRRLDGRMLPKSISDIVAEVRHLKNRTDIKWIVVDYIQRIAGIRKRNDSREREVASVSNMLKQLAVEAGITVFAISAMGRPHKDHMKRRPTMYELRESGQIEFDADIIVLLHNWYLVNHDPEKPMKRLDREAAELIIAKNRNGPTGIAPADFVPASGLWEARSLGTSGDGDYPWEQQQGS